MPNKFRPILLALFLAAAAGAILGCGSDNSPPPSIPAENAATLAAKINEVKSNVDVGSCVVAAAKTDELLADIDSLPSGVNQQVKNALVRGATNLKGLVENPHQCQGRTTTSETTTTTPSTTESTTTTRTQPTTTHAPPTETVPNVTTTPTQTQTTPTPTTGGSGGIGPGGL